MRAALAQPRESDERSIHDLADQALAADQAQFAEWWKFVPDDGWCRVVASIVYRRAYVQGRADGIDVMPRMVARLMGREGRDREGFARPDGHPSEEAS